MAAQGFQVLARGIGFTEGPLWTNGGQLWVVSMNRGLVYGLDPRLRPGAPVTEIETGGGPNGLAEAPGGVLYVAQNGAATTRSRSDRPAAPGLQAIAGGVVRDLVVTGQVAPNDLVVGPDGRVWFTDPVHHPSDAPGSRVCTYQPAAGTVTVVVEDAVFPNGLAFGPDPAQLYVADSATGEILRYRVADAAPYHREVFTRIAGTGPDGIAFDAAGNLYVAAFQADAVIVIDPAGRPVRRLPTGDGSRPTNLCFGGRDLDRLIVTLASGGRVVVAEERFAGRLASPWLRAGPPTR
jgi:gluconolactonase